MKIVSVIPFWDQYQYENDLLQSRDTIRLGGKALINYPIELANKVDKITQTYIFTNNKSIKDLVDSRLNFEVLPRDTALDSQHASIEEIIRSFLQKVDADVVVLLHPNSPFVTKESLEDCVNKVVSGDHDSAFLARVEKKFAWCFGKRVNYSLENGTPHLSTIEPIVLETSSLYVFTRQCFENIGTRIGSSAYVKDVDSFEGMVVTSPSEVKLAEYLLDSKFHAE